MHATTAEASLVKVWLPHFRRAVKLQMLVDGTGAYLDSIPTAFILAGRYIQVRFANAAARRIVEQHDGFRIESGGKLVCDRLAHAHLLKLAYEAMECSTGRSFRAGGVLTI